MVVDLTAELLGFPRHLSQHVGGMVMTRGPLCEMVPIENAAMPNRTVIEWDKNDIDSLGILKVDVLALGMLTCISEGCFGDGKCGFHGGARRLACHRAVRSAHSDLSGDRHSSGDGLHDICLETVGRRHLSGWNQTVALGSQTDIPVCPNPRVRGIFAPPSGFEMCRKNKNLCPTKIGTKTDNFKVSPLRA